MQIAFAVAAGVAAATLLAVAFDRIQRRALVVLAVLAGLAAVAAWVGFGLRPGTSTATAAGGITIAFVAQLAAVKLRDLLRTARRFDDQLARAQGRINSLIAREADEPNAELERTLVRARADTASILAEQERRMAEERRGAAAERARTGLAGGGCSGQRRGGGLRVRATAFPSRAQRAHPNTGAPVDRAHRARGSRCNTSHPGGVHGCRAPPARAARTHRVAGNVELLRCRD